MNFEWFCASSENGGDHMRKVTVIHDMRNAYHFPGEPQQDFEYAEAILLTTEKAGLAAIMEEVDGDTFINVERIVKSEQFPGYYETRDHGEFNLLIRDRYLFDHYHELTPDEFLAYAFEHDTYNEPPKVTAEVTAP